MTAPELTALLLFCTAMSFSPGPNTTLSTALAANLGLKRALRFCFAVPTGWTLLMLGSGLGLGALITGVPALRWAVTLLGVAYMLWLAFKLSRAGQLTEVDSNRLNVQGGSLALGHPLAATGLRLVMTLARQLRQHNLRYGIAAACVGGGQGMAVLIENPDFRG